MYNTYLYNESLYNVRVPYSAFHYFWDGRIREKAYQFNRVYFVGKDADGNPVYGIDDDAESYVDERLYPVADECVFTTAMATTVAGNLNRMQYLFQDMGYIVTPPNLAQEMFDVIRIIHTVWEINALYRVMGIQNVSNYKTGIFQQILILARV